MWKNREKFKAIDGQYSVGSDGVVYSGGLPLQAIRGEWVKIHGERRSVAYLVARAFVPNREGRAYVIHKNGDRKDNRPENLQWSDAEEKGMRRGPKPRLLPVVQYDREGNKVGIYNNVSEALDAARKQANDEDLIYVGGSMYVLAELLTALNYGDDLSDN